jgi:hypothetical protein
VERQRKAEKRHGADFGNSLLLDVEPPFLLDHYASLEARLLFFNMYFSIG